MGAATLWLGRLQALAPPPKWRQRVDWDSDATAGGPFPPDYRAVVDVYGSVAFVGGPHWAGHVSVWSPRNAPDHRPEPAPERDVWGAPDLGQTVGVSRSTGDAWAALAVPDAPVPVTRFGVLGSARNRVLPWLLWAPPQADGLRPIVVRAVWAPDAWVFAMSLPELLVRVLTGTTGCPWLPPEPALEPLEVRTLPTPDDDPAVSGDGWTASDRPAVAAGAPTKAPDEPSIEVLRRDRIPGRGLRSRPRDEANHPGELSLDVLRRVLPPPGSPLQVGDWSAVEALIERPLPADVRELVETYGAGSFVVRGGLADDPPLHLLPASQVQAYGEETLDLIDAHDLNDLLGTDPLDALRVAPFGVLGGGTGEVWLWCLGHEHGIAVVAPDEYHVWPLPGTASDVVLDVVLGRGWFDLGSPPPSAFVASEYQTNDLGPGAAA